MPGKALEHPGIEDIGNLAHTSLDVQLSAVPRDDTNALLPAVLQGIEAQVGHIGGVDVPLNGKDSAHS
jgi:hypothetical protein